MHKHGVGSITIDRFFAGFMVSSSFDRKEESVFMERVKALTVENTRYRRVAINGLGAR